MIIRSDKRSHGRISWKNFEEWGFEITELRSSNGKTTGNRFDFEIAGILRLNQVRNIEGPLCSEITCLVAPRVARCLCTWSCFCAYRMTVTVPVSVRFSLTQTLQGEQYQFIEATIYPPLLLPESHRNWKFRNAELSQGHSWSHAFGAWSGKKKPREKKLAIYRSWPWISNCWEWDSNSGLSGIEPRALTTRPRRLGANLRRDATSCLLFLTQSVLADFDDRKKKLPDLRLVAFQARVKSLHQL